MAAPSCRRFEAHVTRRFCSRARLSGGMSTASRSAITTAVPPIDHIATVQPLDLRGAGLGAGGAIAATDFGAAGDHGRTVSMTAGVSSSAENILAQLLQASVRPRYSSFCIAVIGYG